MKNQFFSYTNMLNYLWEYDIINLYLIVIVFIFEMTHILMSIAAKENHLYRYIDIALYISSTFECNSYLPQSGTLLWKNVYKCICHICSATSYVSRMQKNMISVVFSWWIVVSLITNLTMR